MKNTLAAFTCKIGRYVKELVCFMALKMKNRRICGIQRQLYFPTKAGSSSMAIPEQKCISKNHTITPKVNQVVRRGKNKGIHNEAKAFSLLQVLLLTDRWRWNALHPELQWMHAIVGHIPTTYSLLQLSAQLAWHSHTLPHLYRLLQHRIDTHLYVQNTHLANSGNTTICTYFPT